MAHLICGTSKAIQNIKFKKGHNYKVGAEITKWYKKVRDNMRLHIKIFHLIILFKRIAL